MVRGRNSSMLDRGHTTCARRACGARPSKTDDDADRGQHEQTEKDVSGAHADRVGSAGSEPVQPWFSWLLAPDSLPLS